MNAKHVSQISSHRQNMSMPTTSRKYITKSMVDNRKSVNLKRNKSAPSSSSNNNNKDNAVIHSKKEGIADQSPNSANQINEGEQLDTLLQLTLLIALIGGSSQQ